MPVCSTGAASSEQKRRLYCGCEVPMSTVPCNNCIQCKKHCKCVRCNGCLDHFEQDEICSTCNTCTGMCCSCTPCRTCKRRINSNLSCSICTSCLNCTTCCKCWMCKHDACKASPVNYKTIFPDSTRRAAVFHKSCGQCKEHCKCGVCRKGRHSTFILNMCSNCCECKDHCSCMVCTVCDRRTGEEGFHTAIRFGFTGEVPCGLCLRCCACNVKGVEFRKGKFKLFNSVFSQGLFKRNRLTRHLSCEIEVDKFSTEIRSTGINKALNKWGDSVVSDGSVPGGFEINMNPSNGDLFLQHAKELTNGLAAIKAGCSVACGMHVHVNVKGTPIIDSKGNPSLDAAGQQVFDQRTAYTHYDLRRLVLLYAKVERAMFELCAPSRLDARYSKICGKFYLEKNSGNPKEFRQTSTARLYNQERPLPSLDSPASIESARNNLGLSRIAGNVTGAVFKQIGAKLKQQKQHKYEPVRYKALNLHSFFMRGTVEFRHKEGTVDYTEMTSWALICGHVVDAASRLGDAQLAALPTDSRAALLAVIPEYLHSYCTDKWSKIITTIRSQQAAEELWAGTQITGQEE
jgi:hypothetical protein